MAFPPREEYEHFLYSLPELYSEIDRSTVKLYMNSPSTCFVRGSIVFQNGLELQVFEYLDLLDGELLSYSYTIFRKEEKIRWYDPQSHPENTALKPTFPHHFHESPDIRHNRKPAYGISFAEPNLPTVIDHCIHADKNFI